jgi:hypothetical protein
MCRTRFPLAGRPCGSLVNFFESIELLRKVLFVLNLLDYVQTVTVINM